MGATITKIGLANCCMCIKKKNKISPAPHPYDLIRHGNINSNKLSEQVILSTPAVNYDEKSILTELTAVGIITKKPGGVTFAVKTHNLNENGQKIKRKPRRLPPVKNGKGRVVKSLKEEVFNSEDKKLMAEIRRIGALTDKVEMARQYDERRQAVLNRRNQIICDKIKRTEEKLRKISVVKQQSNNKGNDTERDKMDKPTGLTNDEQ